MIERTFRPKTHKDIAGKRMKEQKWAGSVLRLYAEKVYERPTISGEEVWRIDMTNKFFKELERIVKNRELVKVQINAGVRKGKSTVGIAIGMWVHELIKKYFKKLAYYDTFTMKNIARDDQEKTKAMRNPELMYAVLVTDESNALESTGENSTTEQAQRDVFSEVQAGRYVHNIDICPEGEIDKGSDIKLEVRNREGGMSHCYLYYKINQSWIPLGYVDIDVHKLIENWQNIEKRFFKYLKTEDRHDYRYIMQWAKKDFYIEYQVKKFEKMELMNKHNVLRPRELDYAGINLKIFERVKGLTKIMRLSEIKGTLISYVELEFKRNGIPLSIPGREFAIQRVMSLLILQKNITEIEIKIEKYLQIFNKGKITEKKYNSLNKELEEHKESLTILLNSQLKELNHFETINERYNSHLTDEKEVQ